MNIFSKKLYKNKKKSSFNNRSDSPLNERQLNANLKEDLHILKHEFGNTADLIIREFTINIAEPVKVAAIYIESLADDELVIENLNVWKLKDIWKEQE